MTKEEKDEIYVQNLDSLTLAARRLKRLKIFSNPLIEAEDMVQNCYIRWVGSNYSLSTQKVSPVNYIRTTLFQEFLNTLKKVNRVKKGELFDLPDNSSIIDTLTYEKICELIIKDADNYPIKDRETNVQIINLVLKGWRTKDVMKETGSTEQNVKNIRHRLKDRYKEFVKNNN